MEMQEKTFQKIKLNQYEKTGKFLTTKQIGFIQNGTVPKYLSLFKPDSRDTAIFQGYYGVSCLDCKSWRIEEKANLNCIDCDHSFQENGIKMSALSDSTIQGKAGTHHQDRTMRGL